MITIYRNTNGDTRSACGNVTFEQFQEANDMHRDDVQAVMYELSRMVDKAGELHDCTKKTQEKMFYNDFLKTLKEGADFTDSDWYQLHIKAERHHLLSGCPDDVNLIDVLEMIVNCVCAARARGGRGFESLKIYSSTLLEIDNSTLIMAAINTAKLINGMIEVKDMEEDE